MVRISPLGLRTPDLKLCDKLELGCLMFVGWLHHQFQSKFTRQTLKFRISLLLFLCLGTRRSWLLEVEFSAT